MTSLRRRIFIGSVFWTIGMIALSSAAFAALMDHSPGARLLLASHLHGVLEAPLALAFGVACLVGGALQVRRGLARIDGLRADLAGLHHGRGQRLGGQYPAEVQPLVDDLNALLGERDDAVRRALAKAGDLAHGLKTPLAILAQEAAAAETAGHAELAAALHQQVERMRRQIEYQLAHARAAAGAAFGRPASIRESAEGLARALRRLYADRGITIDVAAAAEHNVRVQREDLDEMLGNLLDNACKWARTRVTVTASVSGDLVSVMVDDDGPGLPDHLREAVLKRGVRADEATPGWGLGLAIVRDLTEIYRGSVALGSSPMGGCRAELRLPVERQH